MTYDFILCDNILQQCLLIKFIATIRDGSAVEIVGLSASVVEWLDEVSAKGVYPHKGVQGRLIFWTCFNIHETFVFLSVAVGCYSY